MVRVRGDVYTTIENKLVKQIGIRANDEAQLTSFKGKKEAEISKDKYIVWTVV